MELRYEKLTYQIRSCIFEVANQIGSGYDEETYHRGLIQSFRRNRVPFISKQKRVLLHREKPVRKFINDFLVFNKIILSLKCVPCPFLQSHYVQLFSELKLWKSDLGMLVNFGLPNIAIERYVFTERAPVFEENYRAIEKRVQPDEKEIIRLIRSIIKNVAYQHKPGFGKVVWRTLVEIELDYQKIQYEKDFFLPVRMYNRKIRSYRFRHFLIENKVLLIVTALQKGIEQIDVSNMQSYLKTLDLNLGLVVNFGKHMVHISGIKKPSTKK